MVAVLYHQLLGKPWLTLSSWEDLEHAVIHLQRYEILLHSGKCYVYLKTLAYHGQYIPYPCGVSVAMKMELCFFPSQPQVLHSFMRWSIRWGPKSRRH